MRFIARHGRELVYIGALIAFIALCAFVFGLFSFNYLLAGPFNQAYTSYFSAVFAGLSVFVSMLAATGTCAAAYLTYRLIDEQMKEAKKSEEKYHIQKNKDEFFQLFNEIRKRGDVVKYKGLHGAVMIGNEAFELCSRDVNEIANAKMEMLSLEQVQTLHGFDGGIVAECIALLHLFIMAGEVAKASPEESKEFICRYIVAIKYIGLEMLVLTIIQASKADIIMKIESLEKLLNLKSLCEKHVEINEELKALNNRLNVM